MSTAMGSEEASEQPQYVPSTTKRKPWLVEQDRSKQLSLLSFFRTQERRVETAQKRERMHCERAIGDQSTTLIMSVKLYHTQNLFLARVAEDLDLKKHLELSDDLTNLEKEAWEAMREDPDFQEVDRRLRHRKRECYELLYEILNL